MERRDGAWWPWIIAGAILLGGGGIALAYKIRGLRNNNPGNIKKGSDDWQGLALQQTDPVFFVFTAPVYGIRALAKILLKYQQTYGLYTVASMIQRWAPSSENDTNGYVQAVADALGVAPTDRIDLVADPAVHQRFVKAIITQENGIQPYSDYTVAVGVQRARVG